MDVLVLIAVRELSSATLHINSVARGKVMANKKPRRSFFYYALLFLVLPEGASHSQAGFSYTSMAI